MGELMNDEETPTGSTCAHAKVRIGHLENLRSSIEDLRICSAQKLLDLTPKMWGRCGLFKWLPVRQLYSSMLPELDLEWYQSQKLGTCHDVMLVRGLSGDDIWIQLVVGKYIYYLSPFRAWILG